MRRLIFIVILILLSFRGYSQKTTFHGGILFEPVHANGVGLNQRIYVIAKDQLGFMWFGTDYGLLRYDGYRTQRIHFPDNSQSSIINTIGIESLAIATDTTLWIGTSRGIFNLDLKTYTISNPKRFQNVNVRSLLYQNDSIIWLGTSEGLYRFNFKTGNRRYYNTINTQLSQNVIRALYMDSSENLWVGTENKLNVLLNGEDKFRSFDLKADHKKHFKNNLILDIKPLSVDNDTVLYIGTETGLCVFNRKKFRFIQYNSQNTGITNDVIKAVYLQNDREVYLGTDLGFFILNLQDGNVDQYYHNPFDQFSINNNEIWNIYADEQGFIWLATSNGISRVNQNNGLFSFVPVYTLGNQNTIGTRVADICISPDSSYLIGTGNGLFRSQDAGTQKEHYVPVLENAQLSIGNISVVFSDSLDRIWLGTVAGLNIWDVRKNRVFIPPIIGGGMSRVSSNYISSILKGYGHDLWIGTWGGGLYKTEISSDATESISLEFVADLNGQLAMGKNQIWALFENELSQYSFNTGKVEKVLIPENLKTGLRLSSIAYSEKEIVWLGSVNELVKYYIEKDSFAIIPMPLETELIVTGLMEDNNGILWGSSNSTLFRYDPTTNQFSYFSQPGDSPLMKFILSPFRKISNDEIIACGYDGFLRFNPGDFYKQSMLVSAHVTAIKVNGSYVFPNQKVDGKVLTRSVILNNQKIVLPNNKNNISLEFSAFNYANKDQVQYTCKLEGYDNNWRILEPGSNSIEYINVPPGKYTLNVKPLTMSLPGHIMAFGIQILKPLWLSFLFLFIYGILFLATAYFIFRQYHRGMRFKAQMDLIQLEQNKNEQLANSKIRFYVNISHELLTSIGLIIDPIKNLLQNSDIRDKTRKTLELVNRNAQFLKIYIDQLLNFRKLETGHKVELYENEFELVSFAKQAIAFFRNRALAKGVTLKLKAEFRQLNILSDEEKLYSILQNLLSNAIKYTPEGGHVTLSLKHYPENQIAIEVKDNGIGIRENEHEKIFERFYQVQHSSSSSGTGIGLTIAKDFTEIMGGYIELESIPGAGSLFRVVLPSQKNALTHANEEPYTKEIVNAEILKNEKPGLVHKLKQDSSLPQVLLIDQNEDVYIYLVSSLQHKYYFSWANSGSMALDLVKTKNPDIIISEIQLPDINGIEFCREVRNNPQTARISVIFLTVKSETENQLKAIEAGVDIFLPKPLEIAVLDANLANLLRRSERTKEFINRRLLISSKEVRIDSKEDKILKEVVEYIHAHITETNISSHDISYAIGISHSSLYRKIKRMTGNSLNEFVRYIRLQKSEQLLSSGKYTVAEIMDQVGFTNHSYFAKCFRNQFGVTPREYQNK